MITKPQQLAAFAKIMKTHKIESYQTKDGEIIKLSPLALVDKKLQEQLVGNANKESQLTDDDLFMSATNFKQKGIK